MAELIALVIFLASLVVAGTMVFKKLPVLVDLPETPSQFDLKKFSQTLKEKAVAINPVKNFSTEIFLQKAISKARILALKAESKTSHWLQALRENSQKKKEKNNDGYWESLKKSAGKK